MPIPMTCGQVLDRYFLEMRCKVLEVAAALDRIDGAQGASPGVDPRIVHLEEAISVLLDGSPDRARRIQMIFSDAYHPDWERPRR